MNFPTATLKLYVDASNSELVELYREHIEKHNASIRQDAYPNSGFDIFVPNTTLFETPVKTQFVGMGVKAQMIFNHNGCAFAMHPRSSISKTPLMLANNTGIIDAGYRGELIGAFRCFETPYTVEKHTRLLQICHPLLYPVLVEMVESEDALSSSRRGSGGFGSTGKIGVIKTHKTPASNSNE